MLLEENKNSVVDVPAHLLAMSPVQTRGRGWVRGLRTVLLHNRDLEMSLILENLLVLCAEAEVASDRYETAAREAVRTLIAPYLIAALERSNARPA